MVQLGSKQIAKISQAESTYAEVISNPTWGVIGVVTGGDMDATIADNKIVGIGSATPQIKYPGKVENTVRLDITNPSADMLNKAITRGADGSLSSFNILVGADTGAWRGIGLKFNSLNIEQAENDLLKASMEGWCKTIATSGVASTGYSPSGSPIWQPEGLVLTVGGTPDADAISFSAQISNNLKRGGVANSSNTPKRTYKYLTEGTLDISMDITTYTEPSFSLEADCPSRTIGVVATYTDLCGGGTLTITFSNGMYLGKNQPLAPDSYVGYKIRLGSFESITIA